MKIGILPLGRPTFDVAFAEENLSAMLTALDATGHEIAGPRALLFDAEALRTAIAGLREEAIDFLLLLQVTFTDAGAAVEAANAFSVPLGIWAIPEPRAGGRLRLNSFCGLNLASHALGLAGRRFVWAYAAPDEAAGEALSGLLAGAAAEAAALPGHAAGGRAGASDHGGLSARAAGIVRGLSGRRIARLGERPEGFHTCDYDPARLRALAGVEVDAIPLDALFEAGRAAPEAALADLRDALALDGLGEVDQAELARSLRLKLGLDALRAKGDYDAFAIRCWPETFTEYGGAVCGPVSMMGEARVPCACEADVYGALTQMILQEAASAPVFLADLVDMDAADDTGVVWHCGQAPLSMLAGGARARATIHTNRKMPLLYEFALKPGRVTFLRISQARGAPKMVIAGGEMLDRPMAFTGTSGVVRFDSPAGAVLDRVIDSGLEHHMALAYGEHRPLLRAVAAEMDLPVLELGE